MGVEILLCSTCVNFFNITNEIAVGEISNMHAILGKMVEADRIIAP